VGGFYRWPELEAIKGLKDEMAWALETSLETVRWSSTLAFPDFEQDYEFVALRREDEYAIYDGEVLSSTGRRLAVREFESAYLETHVRHSNALHSHTKEGNPYFVGPLARLNLSFDQLRPTAKDVSQEIGLELPLVNPYKSLIARAIELVEVCDVALELIEDYNPTGPSKIPFDIKAGEGSGASEAPRGLLYHRYMVDDQGKIRFARINPPTAQNFARMEADLWELAPTALELSHEKATLECEHLLRSYDPCISCATHFLKLEIIEN
jgi:coenzyme F420-reducing hydrogenase alpha subunit